MSDQSSDMGSPEVSHRGHRSKYRQRRGPWEIHSLWEDRPEWNHVWKSYADEEIARENLKRLIRSHTSSKHKYILVYNKDKEKNGR